MLSNHQKSILQLLRKDPYMPQQKIADEIGLSRSATANLITQLVNMGHILGKAYILNDQLEKLIICIGAANVDYKLTSIDPIDFHTSNPAKTIITPGGVMRNIAENCGRLQMNISLLSIIGDDAIGQIILDNSKDLYSTHKITRLSNHKTGSYYAILDKNNDLLVGLADMEISKNMNREWILSHQDYIRNAVSVIVDMNVEKDALVEIIDLTRRYEIPLVIVGVSAPKMNRLPNDVRNVDLGVFNLAESQAFFQTDESSEILAKRWIDKGFLEVVITDSTNDVIYATKTRLNKYPVIKSKQVFDVTGAGDSFVAGLLYGTYNNLSISQSIPYAMANARLTIKQPASVNTYLTPEILEKEVEKNK